MADPTLTQLARDNMGHVSEKVQEYSSKPVIPPRNSQSNNSVTKATQNGNVDRNVSSAFGARTRILEKKKKFHKSEPPLMVPPSSQRLNNSTSDIGPVPTMVSQRLNNDAGTIGPVPMVISDQEQQKVVCVQHEQEFETVNEISPINTQLQISDNESNPLNSPPSKSLSPGNLDSSSDETSDEDVITDLVMGKDVEPEEPSTPPPTIKPVRPDRAKSQTRGRSSVIVKADSASLSPVQHRKHMQTLSDSFKPSSNTSTSLSSVLRSKTFTEKSPRSVQKMKRASSGSLTISHTSMSGTESPHSAKLSEGFVFLESEEVCHIVLLWNVYCIVRKIGVEFDLVIWQILMKLPDLILLITHICTCICQVKNPSN